MLDSSDGQGLHWLYEHAEVMSRRDDEDGLRLTVRVPPDQIERLKRRFANRARAGPFEPETGRRALTRALRKAGRGAVLRSRSICE